MIFTDANELQKMREACRCAASVLEMISDYVQAGISTGELNKICHNFIVNDLQAIPSTYNHHGFPASICTSLNHVVCHGIPSDKEILKEGDILNIDVTVKKHGYIGDTSKMFIIGKAKPWAEKLVQVAQQSLYKAIKVVRPGIHTGDIGELIESYIHQHGYSVVEDYCGHGIGKEMWEFPDVPHFGEGGSGELLQEGMTFTIEPMVNLGKPGIKLLKDGWTEITKDKTLSAQWEHTLLVTEDGCEILTFREEEVI